MLIREASLFLERMQELCEATGGNRGTGVD